MARGKKKPTNGAENHLNSNNASSNDGSMQQLTEGLQKLKINKKKKKKSTEEQPKGRDLTPYQGRRQCFGLYECTKCANDWASSHSWANTWQECLECRAKVYPHRQWPKKKQGKKSGAKPHQQKFCGKCIKIGHYCGYQGQDV